MSDFDSIVEIISNTATYIVEFGVDLFCGLLFFLSSVAIWRLHEILSLTLAENRKWREVATTSAILSTIDCFVLPLLCVALMNPLRWKLIFLSINKYFKAFRENFDSNSCFELRGALIYESFMSIFDVISRVVGLITILSPVGRQFALYNIALLDDDYYDYSSNVTKTSFMCLKYGIYTMFEIVLYLPLFLCLITPSLWAGYLEGSSALYLQIDTNNTNIQYEWEKYFSKRCIQVRMKGLHAVIDWFAITFLFFALLSPLRCLHTYNTILCRTITYRTTDTTSSSSTDDASTVPVVNSRARNQLEYVTSLNYYYDIELRKKIYYVGFLGFSDFFLLPMLLLLFLCQYRYRSMHPLLFPLNNNNNNNSNSNSDTNNNSGSNHNNSYFTEGSNTTTASTSSSSSVVVAWNCNHLYLIASQCFWQLLDIIILLPTLPILYLTWTRWQPVRELFQNNHVTVTTTANDEEDNATAANDEEDNTTAVVTATTTTTAGLPSSESAFSSSSNSSNNIFLNNTPLLYYTVIKQMIQLILDIITIPLTMLLLMSYYRSSAVIKIWSNKRLWEIDFLYHRILLGNILILLHDCLLLLPAMIVAMLVSGILGRGTYVLSILKMNGFIRIELPQWCCCNYLSSHENNYNINSTINNHTTTTTTTTTTRETEETEGIQYNTNRLRQREQEEFYHFMDSTQLHQQTSPPTATAATTTTTTTTLAHTTTTTTETHVVIVCFSERSKLIRKLLWGQVFEAIFDVPFLIMALILYMTLWRCKVLYNKLQQAYHERKLFHHHRNAAVPTSFATTSNNNNNNNNYNDDISTTNTQSNVNTNNIHSNVNNNTHSNINTTTTHNNITMEETILYKLSSDRLLSYTLRSIIGMQFVAWWIDILCMIPLLLVTATIYRFPALCINLLQRLYHCASLTSDPVLFITQCTCQFPAVGGPLLQLTLQGNTTTNSSITKSNTTAATGGDVTASITTTTTTATTGKTDFNNTLLHHQQCSEQHSLLNEPLIDILSTAKKLELHLLVTTSQWQMASTVFGSMVVSIARTMLPIQLIDNKTIGWTEYITTINTTTTPSCNITDTPFTISNTATTTTNNNINNNNTTTSYNITDTTATNTTTSTTTTNFNTTNINNSNNNKIISANPATMTATATTTSSLPQNSNMWCNEEEEVSAEIKSNDEDNNNNEHSYACEIHPSKAFTNCNSKDNNDTNLNSNNSANLWLRLDFGTMKRSTLIKKLRLLNDSTEQKLRCCFQVQATVAVKTTPQTTTESSTVSASHHNNAISADSSSSSSSVNKVEYQRVVLFRFTPTLLELLAILEGNSSSSSNSNSNTTSSISITNNNSSANNQDVKVGTLSHSALNRNSQFEFIHQMQTDNNNEEKSNEILNSTHLLILQSFMELFLDISHLLLFVATLLNPVRFVFLIIGLFEEKELLPLRVCHKIVHSVLPHMDTHLHDYCYAVAPVLDNALKAAKMESEQAKLDYAYPDDVIVHAEDGIIQSMRLNQQEAFNRQYRSRMLIMPDAKQLLQLYWHEREHLWLYQRLRKSIMKRLHSSHIQLSISELYQDNIHQLLWLLGRRMRLQDDMTLLYATRYATTMHGTISNDGSHTQQRYGYIGALCRQEQSRIAIELHRNKKLITECYNDMIDKKNNKNNYSSMTTIMRRNNETTNNNTINNDNKNIIEKTEDSKVVVVDSITDSSSTHICTDTNTSTIATTSANITTTSAGIATTATTTTNASIATTTTTTITRRLQQCGLFTRPLTTTRWMIRQAFLQTMIDILFLALFLFLLITIVRTIPLLRDLYDHQHNSSSSNNNNNSNSVSSSNSSHKGDSNSGSSNSSSSSNRSNSVTYSNIARSDYYTTRNILRKHIFALVYDIGHLLLLLFYMTIIIITVAGIPPFLADLPDHIATCKSAQLYARQHALNGCRYLKQLLHLAFIPRTYRILFRSCLYCILVPGACIAECLPVMNNNNTSSTTSGSRDNSDSSSGNGSLYRFVIGMIIWFIILAGSILVTITSVLAGDSNSTLNHNETTILLPASAIASRHALLTLSAVLFGILFCSMIVVVVYKTTESNYNNNNNNTTTGNSTTNSIVAAAVSYHIISWSYLLSAVCGPIEALQLSAVVLYYQWGTSTDSNTATTTTTNSLLGSDDISSLILQWPSQYNNNNNNNNNNSFHSIKYEYEISSSVAVSLVIVWALLVSIPLAVRGTTTTNTTTTARYTVYHAAVPSTRTGTVESVPKLKSAAIVQSPLYEFFIMFISKLTAVWIIATLMRPSSCIDSGSNDNAIISTGTIPTTTTTTTTASSSDSLLLYCGARQYWAADASIVLLSFFLLTSALPSTLLTHIHSIGHGNYHNNSHSHSISNTTEAAIQFSPIYTTIVRAVQLFVCAACMGTVGDFNDNNNDTVVGTGSLAVLLPVLIVCLLTAVLPVLFATCSTSSSKMRLHIGWNSICNAPSIAALRCAGLLCVSWTAIVCLVRIYHRHNHTSTSSVDWMQRMNTVYIGWAVIYFLAVIFAIYSEQRKYAAWERQLQESGLQVAIDKMLLLLQSTLIGNVLRKAHNSINNDNNNNDHSDNNTTSPTTTNTSTTSNNNNTSTTSNNRNTNTKKEEYSVAVQRGLILSPTGLKVHLNNARSLFQIIQLLLYIESLIAADRLTNTFYARRKNWIAELNELSSSGDYSIVNYNNSNNIVGNNSRNHSRNIRSADNIITDIDTNNNNNNNNKSNNNDDIYDIENDIIHTTATTDATADAVNSNGVSEHFLPFRILLQHIEELAEAVITTTNTTTATFSSDATRTHISNNIYNNSNNSNSNQIGSNSSNASNNIIRHHHRNNINAITMINISRENMNLLFRNKLPIELCRYVYSYLLHTASLRDVVFLPRDALESRIMDPKDILHSLMGVQFPNHSFYRFGHVTVNNVYTYSNDEHLTCDAQLHAMSGNSSCNNSSNSNNFINNSNTSNIGNSGALMFQARKGNGQTGCRSVPCSGVTSSSLRSALIHLLERHELINYVNMKERETMKVVM